MAILRSLFTILLLLGVPTQACAAAAEYPVRPVHLIVPTTPGSVPDVVARLVAEHMTSDLRQPVIVENRPGAGGTIGLGAVAKAPPDGYTIGVLNLPYTIASILVKDTPYDTERDLAPVALAAWNYPLLCVREDSPYRSVADFVAAARRQPGALKYSSQGIATPGDLAMKLLQARTGIRLVHVPYKGGPPAVNALVAGEVDAHVGGLAVLGGQIDARVLRPLATLAPERIAAYPDLPTMTELGYEGVELRDFQGFVAPAGTAPEIVARLAVSVEHAVESSEVAKRLERFGMQAAHVPGDGFARLIHDQLRIWREVARDAHIGVE